MNVPQLRFNGFSGEYTSTSLSKISEKIKRSDSSVLAPVMMLSAGKGFILQSDKYSKEMAGQSLKKYVLLQKNEFAYNHGASKLKPFGCCYALKEENAHIPFVYHCFKINEGYYKYYDYLLNHNMLDRQLKRLISSTARMDGLLNISYDSYVSISINIPTLPEQEKIADFLSTLDEKIQTEQDILDNLIKQKKGYTQKLFNQELRFDSFTDDWEDVLLGEYTSVKMCKRILKEQTNIIGEVPFYKIGTIGSKADAYISLDLFNEFKSKYNYPSIGEIMLTCSGTVGKCFKYNGENAYFQDSNIVWLKNDSKLLSNDYLYFVMFNYNWNKLNKTTITRIYNDDLRNLQIPLPSLAEQEKIADFLSTFDEKIDNQSCVVDNLLLLKKGLLQQLFC